jgi:hypothetical protein
VNSKAAVRGGRLVKGKKDSNNISLLLNFEVDKRNHAMSELFVNTTNQIYVK